MPSNSLGIDVGGTKIYVGRYNQQLELEAETQIPTQAQAGKEATLDQIEKAIKELQNSDTKSIGIAWAGFVNRETGQIIKAPNVPALNGFSLVKHLESITGLPITLENDARAFTFGAKNILAPKSKLCVGLIIGTGVGGGIVMQNQLLYGAHGYAGEIGHQVIAGKEVEAWLAGPGLKTQIGISQDTRFSEILPDRSTDLLPQLEEVLEVFAQWLSGIVLAYDPDTIILGGGTAQYFWQFYQSEIRRRTQAQLQGYPNHFDLYFYQENNAGAAGAAALSMIK